MQFLKLADFSPFHQSLNGQARPVRLAERVAYAAKRAEEALRELRLGKLENKRVSRHPEHGGVEGSA